jgi:Ti-type conjugative transfer relaxase TraA
MIPRCIIGKGVTGAVQYVLGEGRGAGNDNLAPGEQSRVDWFSGTGFGFAIESQADAELATRIMEFDALNQSSRTRKCEDDCVHLSLAWRPGQTPTREEMEAAAHGALKAMGMENAKALFTSHNDESYAHVHIVASKINPATGYAYDLKGNWLSLSRWGENYEREHGGVVCLRREAANRLRDAIDARDAGAVLEAMTEQRPTFTTRDLERALRKQLKDDMIRARLAEGVLNHAEAVRLADGPDGPVARYTSRAVIEAEQHVLRAADGLMRNGRHALTDHARATVLSQAKYESMRREQALAVRHATGEGGLAVIDGQAGTGKSYTMAAIRETYEAAGRYVVGLAPTNAVTQGMHQDGFKRAATVHSELFALNNGRIGWNDRTVVMVDEAAMLDTKLMAMVTARAFEARSKLILVGDDRQLSSIERGGMFGALKDRYGAAVLTEVTRQHEIDDRRAASMMADGNFHDALAMYDAKGGIAWTRTQDQARAALVQRWAEDTATAPGKSRFVFAYTNIDVAQLNADLRAVRRERGELGRDYEIRTAEGTLPFAAGDRLQFTGTNKARGLHSGAVGTVQAIDGRHITVLLDGRQGRKVTIDSAEFGKFRHGYAGTIYQGQSRTLDRTYLYHSEHWRSAASYVALTRHRDKAELFVARNTAKDLTQLARQMARVDDRRAASQFHQVDDSEPVRPLSPRELAGSFNQRKSDRQSDPPASGRGLDIEMTEAQAAHLRQLLDGLTHEPDPEPEHDPGRDGWDRGSR